MCDLALDLDKFGGGAAQFAAEIKALAPLAEQGLLTIEGGRITVTPGGGPYVRIAAAAFDTYLAASQKRHSVAV